MCLNCDLNQMMICICLSLAGTTVVDLCCCNGVWYFVLFVYDWSMYSTCMFCVESVHPRCFCFVYIAVVWSHSHVSGDAVVALHIWSRVSLFFIYLHMKWWQSARRTKLKKTQCKRSPMLCPILFSFAQTVFKMAASCYIEFCQQ